MQFQVDLLLKGEEQATTETIDCAVPGEPRVWTDADAATVIKEMLAALDRKKHPQRAGARPVFLRGISWIVDVDRAGGVLIALEIPMGAAVAGPFDIPQPELERIVANAMARDGEPSSKIH
jgi:hypothetical protein